MLHGSDDYKFVIVEDFGIVSSYAPRTVFGDVQTMVVVRPLPAERTVTASRGTCCVVLSSAIAENKVCLQLGAISKFGIGQALH